jgi:beta-lactamase class A
MDFTMTILNLQSMRAAAVMFASCLTLAPATPVMGQDEGRTQVQRVVMDLERDLGARIGFSVRDEKTGRELSYRGDERFALTSTFKAFACAGMLLRVDAGQDKLERRIAFRRSALVSYSPVTERHADGQGLTLGELCAATLRTSDNTAANLVLDAIGGPAGLTAFMRKLGDPRTRIDRREPGLNEAAPGDPRDTTTPSAATASLSRLLLGDALRAPSRAILTGWMQDNAVAGPLLRKALPSGWRIADRTGAGGFGARAIIATVWPSRGSPQVVAIYLAETTASMDQRNDAIARIGVALVASHEKQ